MPATLSVIMPVYNERLTVSLAISRVLKQPQVTELLVVDDGSTDGSREILKTFAGTDPRLRLFFSRKNRGKGAAVAAGIERARGEIVTVQDADLEYDPRDLPRLLQPLLDGKADVVYGSRFRGESQRVFLFWHYLGNQIVTAFSNIFTNLNLSDMETCAKVVKSSWVQQIPLRSRRFGFEAELTMKLAKCGARFYEVPIVYSGRGYAEGKKITYRDGLEALWTILKYYFLDDVEKSPGSLFRLRDLSTRYLLHLVSLLNPYVGEEFLELGAGRGSITYQFLDRLRIATSDWAPFFVGELRSRFQPFPHVTVQELHPETMALRKKWGAILALNVLEKMERDAQVLKNCRSALSKKGHLLLLVPAHRSFHGFLEKQFGIKRRYEKGELHQLLLRCGLSPVKTWECNRAGYLFWRAANRMRSLALKSHALKLYDFLFSSLEKSSLPGLSYLCLAVRD